MERSADGSSFVIHHTQIVSKFSSVQFSNSSGPIPWRALCRTEVVRVKTIGLLFHDYGFSEVCVYEFRDRVSDWEMPFRFGDRVSFWK